MKPDIKVEIQEEWYSIEQCNDNPNKVYVFGDNMKGYGKLGQATIRQMCNSYGIATKRSPTMNDNSFYGDRQDEMDRLFLDIYGLFKCVYESEGLYDTIVLPADGLGTGLSKMPEKSPRLFAWMNETLSLLLNVDYKPRY